MERNETLIPPTASGSRDSEPTTPTAQPGTVESETENPKVTAQSLPMSIPLKFQYYGDVSIDSDFDENVKTYWFEITEPPKKMTAIQAYVSPHFPYSKTCPGDENSRKLSFSTIRFLSGPLGAGMSLADI